MGLIDRDYMRDPDRKNPFSPPPEKPILGWLIKISVFILVIYVGFKLAAWLDTNRLPASKQTVKVLATEGSVVVQPNPLRQVSPQTTIYPPIQPAPTAPAVITKCVVQGKVSYGDGGCTVGAIASGVAIKNNHNLIPSVKVPVVVQTPVEEPPSQMTAQVNPSVGYAATKEECVALDERVKYLDSLARQPQSGQTQDWIRAERKKARDRQFSIRCT